MGSPPPPMLLNRRTLVGLLIFIGLAALFVGALLHDLSNAEPNPGESQADQIARLNLGRVWAPAAQHFGMFLFVVGLLGAALFFEELDVFARLFLIILAFVSVLLILANSISILGVPRVP